MNSRWIFLAGTLLFVQTIVVSGASDVAPTNAVPLHEIPVGRREMVKNVVEKATLYAKGPSESFFCRPEQYYWFLDHPDRAVTTWRRLGATCVTIAPRGPNLFGWTDDQGSEVNWVTVFRGPYQRVWFAEGKVKPAPLMPMVPVKAVVVINHSEGRSPAGSMVLHHQSEIYLHTDSKSAAVVTKMFGTSATKVAEQGLGQLQLFFSGVSWYLDRHPDKAEDLLKE